MSVDTVRLTNPQHRLPFPGQPGRFLDPAGEPVDTADAFWAVALADGSVEIVPPQSASASVSVSLEPAPIAADLPEQE